MDHLAYLDTFIQSALLIFFNSSRQERHAPDDPFRVHPNSSGLIFPTLSARTPIRSTFLNFSALNKKPDKIPHRGWVLPLEEGNQQKVEQKWII